MKYLLMILVFAFVVACRGGGTPSGNYISNNPVNPPQSEVEREQARNSVFMKAVVRNDMVEVRRLIANGVNVNESVDGPADAPITPLLASLIMGNEAMAHELLSAGASVSITYKGYRLADFGRLKEMSPDLISKLRGERQ